MSLTGKVLSDRYELRRELAQGGMATVYLGHDRLLDRPVAVKVLFPEYAREPSFVERFRREAQAAANLSHPNIVAIYDWGQEDGNYFIVMEYVEGRPLREVIRTEGPLGAEQASEIAAEIAAALAFAHEHGVVLRDVKPGNVLMTRTGTVKVTDFGIARAGTADGLTQTGSVMGTATYFSPEQAQGLPVDGRSDVYALGVVCYEMVTGAPPFTGDTPVAVAFKHVRETPEPPSLRNALVPAAFEQIILTAMAKDPAHRYRSATDMRSDLLLFRRGRPLAAAPVTAVVATTGTAVGTADTAHAATMAIPPTPGVGSPGAAPPRRRMSSQTRALLVLGGLVVVIGSILLLTNSLASSSQVDVPDVVGKKIGPAQAALRDAGLIPEVQRVISSQPVDIVLDQSPAAGKSVREKTTVTIVVSSGRERVAVPTGLVGSPVQEAVDRLRGAGFVVNVEERASETAPVDTVISANPPGGTQAPYGSTVTLVASTGPAPGPVPDVVGRTENDAVQQLSGDGFTEVRIIREPNETVPPGTVIRTEPSTGTEIPKSDPVRVYVSSGPTPTTTTTAPAPTTTAPPATTTTGATPPTTA
ncbi:MAG: Stk1 family PASTA domain-containing Ser/Thr kinase [Planctomycetota bacterium]